MHWGKWSYLERYHEALPLFQFWAEHQQLIPNRMKLSAFIQNSLFYSILHLLHFSYPQIMKRHTVKIMILIQNNSNNNKNGFLSPILKVSTQPLLWQTVPWQIHRSTAIRLSYQSTSFIHNKTVLLKGAVTHWRHTVCRSRCPEWPRILRCMTWVLRWHCCRSDPPDMANMNWTLHRQFKLLRYLILTACMLYTFTHDTFL